MSVFVKIHFPPNMLQQWRRHKRLKIFRCTKVQSMLSSSRSTCWTLCTMCHLSHFHEFNLSRCHLFTSFNPQLAHFEDETSQSKCIIKTVDLGAAYMILFHYFVYPQGRVMPFDSIVLASSYYLVFGEQSLLKWLKWTFCSEEQKYNTQKWDCEDEY